MLIITSHSPLDFLSQHNGQVNMLLFLQRHVREWRARYYFSLGSKNGKGHYCRVQLMSMGLSWLGWWWDFFWAWTDLERSGQVGKV